MILPTLRSMWGCSNASGAGSFLGGEAPRWVPEPWQGGVGPPTWAWAVGEGIVCGRQ